MRQVFSLGAWAPLLPTGFRVSGGTHDPQSRSHPGRRLRDSHPLRSPLPAAFASAWMLSRALCRGLHRARSTPVTHRRQPVPHDGFGLLPVRSPLLRESSLFLGVREMFQFPRCPPGPKARCPVSPRTGCPIRRSQDHQFPALPLRISPRGRVLHRPVAPRHPPCAHTWFMTSRITDDPAVGFVVRAMRPVGVRSHAWRPPAEGHSFTSRKVSTCSPWWVEPRGFEPRTSAVQGRRSPG